MQTQESTQNMDGVTVYKSRWGWHPCSYETFLKIKKLYKIYHESRIAAKRYYCWARKAEHNRKGPEPQLIAPFNSLGSANIAITWEEPHTSANGPYLLKDRSGLAYFPNGRYGPDSKSVIVRNLDIPALYQRARMPKKDPDFFSSSIPEGKIDALLRTYEEDE